MKFSAYQIELLLEDFQKNILPLDKSPTENLSISDDAFNESRQNYRNQNKRLLESITPQKIKDLIEDKTTYNPIIDYVQQSRAGRFINPVYIPKTKVPSFSLVNDFSQNKKLIQMEKKELTLDSPIYNSSEETKNNKKVEQKLRETYSKSMNIDSQKTPNEEPSKALTNYKKFPSANHKFLNIRNEKNKKISKSYLEELTEDFTEDNDVVFGEGIILASSIYRFVSDYPESAIKFLLRKNTDGRPLPAEYEQIYKKWEERGLSREKLKKLLFNLMKWEKLPDIPVVEILKIVREYLFDLRERNNARKKI